MRVSTQDQGCEKNKADILSFANERNFGQVELVEEKVSGKVNWKNRKIKNIIDELGHNDRLILPELLRLGRSMLEIMEILSISKEKEICIYAVKVRWELNGSIQSKVMAMVFSMVSEIERDLISSRTKEGLRAARVKERLLGRPKGRGKSKLDQSKPEIIALLNNGSTKTFIARRYKTTVPNLYNFLRKNKIDSKPIKED